MKNYFVLLLALVFTTNAFSQQIYNDLIVKKTFTSSGTTTFNTSYSGVAKLTAGVLSASAIVNADILNSASIAYSKFASMSTGQVLLGNAGVPTATTLSGGITVGATGVVTLGNSAVLTQLLTGYTSGAGTVSSSDTIISAFGKLNGNIDLKIDKSTLGAKGDLISATSANTPTAVAVGNDGELLSATSSNAKGLSYRPVKESLSVMDQFQGLEAINTWSTGNNANVMGGGTLNGVLALDTNFPYKYTQGSSSLNDYWCSPAKPVKDNFKSVTLYVPTPYTYNGATNDIQVSVYDATNATVIQSFSPASLVAYLNPNTQVLSGSFSSSTNSYRICYQVKSANNGKILSYGPISTSKSISELGVITSTNRTTWEPCTFPSLTWNGLGTITNNLLCKRDGDTLKIQGRFVTGTVSGTTVSIPFPNNYGVITTKSNLLAGISGPLYRGAATGNSAFSLITTPGTSVFNLAGPLVSVANSPSAPVGGSVLTSAEVQFVPEMSIPIQEWVDGTINISSANQQVSSDTLNLVHKTSALVDSDPVGTFITVSFATSTNTATICATAPTQTISSMNANGFFVTARPYNAASTCALPAAFFVKIGKGMKAIGKNVFQSTGKSNTLNYDIDTVSSTTKSGIDISYIETLGAVEINAGLNIGAITTRYVGYNNSISYETSGYVSINASTTPSLTSIPIVGNTYVSGLSDGQYAHKFDFSFGNSGPDNACSNTTLCPYFRQKGGITNVKNSGATGRYTVTFPRTYAQIYCYGSGYSAGVSATFMTGEGAYIENSSTITLYYRSPSTNALTDSGGTVSCTAYL